ncbi:MAG: nucleotidyl transferase AbiEii/AbiGii toxin family protein [Desulfobacterales bacterium]
MTSPKLKNLLGILCQRLSAEGVPHALMGAMALALYGVPRYTADIDILSGQKYKDVDVIKRLMADLGFDCFQETEAFAQFDSELGVYGKVDFMFVHTDDGMAMLERAILVNDDFWGEIPVIQPTDYAILKLMAIANNPARKTHDMADLEALFKTASADLLHPVFNPIDRSQLKAFAKRFGVLEFLESVLPLLASNNKWDSPHA